MCFAFGSSSRTFARDSPNCTGSGKTVIEFCSAETKDEFKISENRVVRSSVAMILKPCFETKRYSNTPNLGDSVSEVILATAASILCLKSRRSTGSGGTYTQSLMNPTDKNHMASDRVNVEAMRNKLYCEALCGKSIGRVQ
ncbi:hypothetical protein TNCV_3663831 [Trichonephila clavipes]|nr:hypothetical protein TNCV_3663831 [Trichonephila clavipes]